MTQPPKPTIGTSTTRLSFTVIRFEAPGKGSMDLAFLAATSGYLQYAQYQLPSGTNGRPRQTEIHHPPK